MDKTNLKNSHRKRANRNKYAAPIGGIFILLAVVGLITIVLGSVKLTGKIMDNSRQIVEFENIVKPVLMFDPVPFDDVTSVDNDTLLQSSVWSALLSGDKASFTYSETGMLLLPSSDIDVACAKLFGASVKLIHRTFGDYEMTYYYDEQTKTYQVPLMVQVGFYTPKVEKISKKGDIVSLIVGYLPPGNVWTTDITGNKYEPTPDKYMVYELKKVKGNYFISAIKDPPPEYNQYPQAS
ncbi:MAG: hypothetical protein RSD67_02350 [Oscillospiraceae bacterium]